MGCSVFMRNSHYIASANARGQGLFRRPKSAEPNLFMAGLLCLWVVLTGSVLLQGQQAPPPSPPATEGYPVTVEGHEVFQIYEAFGPISAHDRAETGFRAARPKLVYTPGADLAAITTAESDYGTEIRLGDNVLTIVSDDDAKRMHVARAALAKYYASQIRNAVTAGAAGAQRANSWFEPQSTP